MSTKRDRGSTLIEVMITAVLIAVSLTALASLMTVSIARNRLAKERAVATRLAQEAVEWLRFQRDYLGFDIVYGSVDPSKDLCLESVDLPDDIIIQPNTICAGYSLGIYKRQLTVTGSGGDTIGYTVTVAWKKNTTEDNKVALTGVLKKWAN